MHVAICYRIVELCTDGVDALFVELDNQKQAVAEETRERLEAEAEQRRLKEEKEREVRDLQARLMELTGAQKGAGDVDDGDDAVRSNTSSQAFILLMLNPSHAKPAPRRALSAKQKRESRAGFVLRRTPHAP